MTPLCIHRFALVYCGIGEQFLFHWGKGGIRLGSRGLHSCRGNNFLLSYCQKKNLLLSFFNELNYAVNLGMPSWVCLLSIYAVI
jgi:hypothetical protein